MPLDRTLDNFPDKAGAAAREAWVPGARGKRVPAAGRRKVYSCMNFMHRASSQVGREIQMVPAVSTARKDRNCGKESTPEGTSVLVKE